MTKAERATFVQLRTINEINAEVAGCSHRILVTNWVRDVLCTFRHLKV